MTPRPRKILISIICIIISLACAWFFFSFRLEKRRLEIAKLPPLERGKALLEEEGCTSCHQNGNAYRAPILEKLYGREVRFASGDTTIANRDYIIRSILDPKSQIVLGYQGVMPAYADRFSKEEIDAFVEAMK
jgi:cytochrome c oxidase subunit 2